MFNQLCMLNWSASGKRRLPLQLAVLFATLLPAVSHSAEDEAKSAESKKVTALEPKPFRLSAEAIQLAKQTAAAELAKRGSLKDRRPPGLGDLDSPAGIQRAIDTTLAELAESSSADSARERLRYLGPAAFLSLVKGLESENELTRMHCAQLLEYHGTRAIDPLGKALKADSSAKVRANAASALAQSFDPAAAPLLIAALDDPAQPVRQAAVFALRFLRDPNSVEPLRRVQLGPGAQHIVADVLRDVEGPKTEGVVYVPPELLEIYQLARDSNTLAGERYGQAEIDRLLEHVAARNWAGDCCATAIQFLDARSAVPVVIQRANWQCDVLAAMATPEAVDYLIENLSSKDQEVRCMTVRSLNYAGRWAVPLLVELLNDPTLTIEHSFSPLQREFGLEDDTAPREHWAKVALYLGLGNAGLKGKFINLASGKRPDDLQIEVQRIQEWYRLNGSDFLVGKLVPNPEVTNCGWHE